MRCSHPDLDLKTVAKDRAIVPQDGVIYWHLANYTPDLDQGAVLAAFHKAFSAWELDFLPIKFSPTHDIKKAPIVIYFKSNGDKGLPSPFSNNTLAYAYLPYRGSLGIHANMFFNDKVNWGEMHSPGRINLFKVAVHELGHAFGLHHSTDVKDIMYPTYQPNDEVIITKETQDAIDYLYEQYRGPRQSAEPQLQKFLSALFPNKRRLWKLTERQLARIGAALELDVDVKYRKRRNVNAVFTALHPDKQEKEMSIFSRVGDWFNDLLIKRVVGVAVRKGLDWVVGALLAVTGVPIIASLTEWIVTNQAQIEASIIAGLLGLITSLWSVAQKREDVGEIKRLKR